MKQKKVKLNILSNSLSPFLKSRISRNETEKVKLNMLSNSLSPFINGFITRKS